MVKVPDEKEHKTEKYVGYEYSVGIKKDATAFIGR